MLSNRWAAIPAGARITVSLLREVRMAQDIRNKPYSAHLGHYSTRTATNLETNKNPAGAVSSQQQASSDKMAQDPSPANLQPRQLSHGALVPASTALRRAYAAKTWQPPPLQMSRAFRDSPVGQAWQMAHFQTVLDTLGPKPTPQAISRTRRILASCSRGIPAAEIEAFVHDMCAGTVIFHAYLVRILHLPPRGPRSQDSRENFAKVLCSEFSNMLGSTHKAVQHLFVQTLQQRAHIH